MCWERCGGCRMTATGREAAHWHRQRSIAVQHFDQGPKRGGRMPPAWVVKAEAFLGRHPLIQQRYKTASRDIGLDAPLRHVGEAGIGKCGTPHQRRVVKRQGTRYVDSELSGSLPELPRIAGTIGELDTDTPMIEKVGRNTRCLSAGKIGR